MSWNEEYQENHYYLKNRGVWSNVFTIHIEEMFQERMKSIYGYSIDLSKKGMKGTYTNPNIQDRWEEFFNGFRLGEDTENDELNKKVKRLRDTINARNDFIENHTVHKGEYEELKNDLDAVLRAAKTCDHQMSQLHKLECEHIKQKLFKD